MMLVTDSLLKYTLTRVTGMKFLWHLTKGMKWRKALSVVEIYAVHIFGEILCPFFLRTYLN